MALLPECYRSELPSPEAIADRLRLWDGNVGDSLIEWIQSEKLVAFAVEADRCVVQFVD